MYTQFFGLREKPFAITPDPQFLYLSYRHGEALAHLLYGVTESGGFIQLTGEVGTGKTLLTRTLLGRLPADIDLAVILNPRQSDTEFLETIFDELHLAKPADRSIKQLVDELNQHLLDAHARGRRIVLLVDEAQNLQADVLEQLRLLTNLETSKQKLLQIILVGQPELRQTLARTDLRQLAQRITGRYHLENLTRAETQAYIEHRLKVAGAQRQIFKRGAMAQAHRSSGGVPRLINVICDRALLGAYTEEQPMVTRQLVREAAAEVSGLKRPLGFVNWAPAVGFASMVVIASAAAIWLLLQSTDVVEAGKTVPASAKSSAGKSVQPANSHLPPPVTVDEPQTSGLTLARSLSVPARTTRQRAEVDTTVVQGAAFRELLARSGNLTGTDSAMRALLQLWGVNIDDNAGAPCQQIRSQNLKCEFQLGSWTLLEQLDRPAILSLVAPGGETHQVVLAGIADDRAHLALGGQRVSVPARDLRELWFGEYLLVWRPNPVADNLMVPGISSDGVGWLRLQLEQLQGGETVASNYYDSALAERVKAFQRDRSLEVDGKAGVHTLIALNGVIDNGNSPRLTGSN